MVIRTTLYTAMQETPFKVTYEYETMIPIKVKQPSDQHEMYKEAMNKKQWRNELDLLLKIREEAKLRNEKHKALIA